MTQVIRYFNSNSQFEISLVDGQSFLPIKSCNILKWWVTISRGKGVTVVQYSVLQLSVNGGANNTKTNIEVTKFWIVVEANRRPHKARHIAPRAAAQNAMLNITR